jgi:hypothetical protein
MGATWLTAARGEALSRNSRRLACSRGPCVADSFTVAARLGHLLRKDLIVWPTLNHAPPGLAALRFDLMGCENGSCFTTSPAEKYSGVCFYKPAVGAGGRVAGIARGTEGQPVRAAFPGEVYRRGAAGALA